MTKISRSVESVQASYGSLSITDATVDLSIKCTDPDEFPDMNFATCTSFSKETSSITSVPKLSHLNGKLSLISDHDYSLSQIKCFLEIPLKYGNLQIDKF